MFWVQLDVMGDTGDTSQPVSLYSSSRASVSSVIDSILFTNSFLCWFHTQDVLAGFYDLKFYNCVLVFVSQFKHAFPCDLIWWPPNDISLECDLCGSLKFVQL